MRDDVDRILISRRQIEIRVQELAEQITRDHSSGPGDAEITIVPVLTGALVFCSDLIRRMPMRMKIGLMAVSSYPGAQIRSGGANVQGLRPGHIAGRHVLVVDDILDSGGTLRAVVPILREQGAVSVKTCVLLRKDRESALQMPVDYVGFDIPDEFVVGYGLDFDDYYRNLPDIVTLKSHLTSGR